MEWASQSWERPKNIQLPIQFCHVCLSAIFLAHLKSARELHVQVVFKNSNYTLRTYLFSWTQFWTKKNIKKMTYLHAQKLRCLHTL